MRTQIAAAAIGLVFIVAGCGPTPQPSGAPSPFVGDSSWQSVGPALGECDVHLAVVRGDGKLVAICQDNLLRPHILTTSDGLAWEVTEPTGIETRGQARVPVLNGLIEDGGASLLLVGADALDDLSGGDAAVWTSQDGVSWTKGPRSRSLRDGQMLGVVATEAGFIGVGADGYPGAGVQRPGLRSPAVWDSNDRASWRRTAIAAGPEPLLMDGIVAIPDGFVAWGGGAPPGTGASWTSADGADWTRSADPLGGSWGPIGRVAASPESAVVAVGCSPQEIGDQVPGLWLSMDQGRTWTEMESEPGLARGCLWDVIWTGDQFLATGAGAQLLTSPDGAAWATEPVDATMAPVTLRLLMRLGDSIIVFGSMDSDERSTAGIWRRGPPR